MGLKLTREKDGTLTLVYEDEELEEYLITRTGLLQQIKNTDYTQAIIMPFENELERIDLRTIEDINTALAIIKIAGKVARLVPNREVSIEEIAKLLITMYYNAETPEALKYRTGIPIAHMILAGIKLGNNPITFKDLELLYYMAIKNKIANHTKARQILEKLLNIT